VFFVNFVVLILKHLNFESRVVGYYALAAGSVTRKKDIPGEIKRNMPEPILVLALGRLALVYLQCVKKTDRRPFPYKIPSCL